MVAGWSPSSASSRGPQLCVPPGHGGISGVCPCGGTASGDAQGEAARPAARLTAWSPLRIGVYGFAAGEASFLKCISSSRSLTIEALIKAEINFCQRTSRAQSVLFLQEPRSLARTESIAGRGELCRKKLKHQSRFATSGANSCWKTSCITTLRTGARRQGNAMGFGT